MVASEKSPKPFSNRISDIFVDLPEEELWTELEQERIETNDVERISMHGQNSKFRPSSKTTNDEAKPSPSLLPRGNHVNHIRGPEISAEHEWVNIVNEIATIGTTDYAQDALTDVVWVELPMIGDKVESWSLCECRIGQVSI